MPTTYRRKKPLLINREDRMDRLAEKIWERKVDPNYYSRSQIVLGQYRGELTGLYMGRMRKSGLGEN